MLTVFKFLSTMWSFERTTNHYPLSYDILWQVYIPVLTYAASEIGGRAEDIDDVNSVSSV